MTIFSVPGPVKALFDHFPLQTYPSISKRDEAMNYELAQRTYDFQGPNALQADINDTFTLGVYNTFQEPSSDVALATDPWCLYAQLSLCKKNSLKLPRATKAESNRPSKPRQKMALLSPLATQNESLPILVEGYNKRFIRSSDDIHDSLKSRAAEDPPQLMYISLLEHVIYDCWMTQVLYHLNNDDFLKLYSFESCPGRNNLLVQRLAVQGLKASLIKRNEFFLRHKVLAQNIESTGVSYNSTNLLEILDPILERCRKVFLQFEKLFQSKQFVDSPTHLELKIASYVLCIMNLPIKVPLRSFLEERCKTLVNHSRAILNKFKN